MTNKVRVCGVEIVAVAASLLLLGACEGKLDKNDAGGLQPDWGSYPDFGTADAPAGDAPVAGDVGGTKEAAAGDSAVVEGGGNKQDGGPVGVCAKWSGWSCAATSPYLCKASCQTGSKKYVLTCLSTGHCVCGIAGGACGPFAFTQPCDACKQAISCCSP